MYHLESILTFGKISNSYNLSERKYILFIGNDLRRDYDFVLDLADKLHDKEFIFLSSRINKNQVSRENVKLISGMWWNNKVSDVEIKSLYSNAIVTILPITKLTPTFWAKCCTAINVNGNTSTHY